MSSRKCRAYSKSKLGLEPTDNRQAFYAGWDAALAQQDELAQEPVAWIYQNAYTEQEYLVWKTGTGGRNWKPLYIAPPQRKPLTDQEIWDAVQHGVVGGIGMPSKAIAVARAIERAHGIGETK